MMKKTLAFATSAMILTACSHAQSQGEMLCLDKGKSDAHGCFQNLGESYSYLKKACVQVFDVAQIKLTDPNNDTLAIYGIQSANKARVELFGADIAENTILRKTQHGYATADGKIRLQKSKRGWKLHQAK